MQVNPTHFPEREAHFKIEGPAGNLELLSLKAKHPENVVAVICHPHPLFQGTMHNKVVYTLSRAFQHRAIASVRFNYRGVGQSQGTFGDSQGEVEDLCAVVDWVKKVEPDAQLILAGFSFGSYIAAKGSTLYPCRQLFMLAPSINNQPFDQLEIETPLVVVQGEKDEVIEMQAVYDWYGALKTSRKQLIRMPETSHFFHGKLIDLRNLIEEKILPLS